MKQHLWNNFLQSKSQEVRKTIQLTEQNKNTSK